MTPLGLRILRTMAGEPGRVWSCSAIVSTWRPERVAPVAVASALRALARSRHVDAVERRGYVSGYLLTVDGLAAARDGQLALPPSALTFGSATAALALLGRAAGPARAAEVDALQAVLSGVACALRAPSDAPLLPALLDALGRRL